MALFAKILLPGDLLNPVHYMHLLIPAAVLLTPALVAQPAKRGKDRPSCDVIRERLKRDGPSMAMIDPIPDLLQGEGITTDPKILATSGRSVRGVASGSWVLLRFRANFAGERLQLTILNDAGEPSRAPSEDGGLAQVPITTSGIQTLFQSFHFDWIADRDCGEEWSGSHSVCTIPRSGEFRP